MVGPDSASGLGHDGSCLWHGVESVSYTHLSLLAKRSASNARGKRRGILPSQNAAASSIPRDISAGDSMHLKYRNRKIRTFVRERSQRFGICSQLKMRLAQLREAQDIRSAKSARNPRLGEAGRNGGKDGEMRGIR